VRSPVRIERRLTPARWLMVAVPISSFGVALVLTAIVLAATGHNPLSTYRTLFTAAFTDDGALSNTFVSATPLLFTGLAAAVAFRMNLFNIGGEGQLYFGAIAASAVGILLGGQSAPVAIGAMVLAGAAGGAVWGLIPAVLRAFLRTNEIITTLMLNYVALHIMYYLIYGSQSYWRDTSTPDARVFPQGKILSDAATWPTVGSSVIVPLGFFLATGLAIVVWLLYSRTRFGFESAVIADSPRAARYAGMRTRRKILAVLCLSGALAGIGGASQVGDFRHQLDPRGLQQSLYGYAGIVVAALARYNPLAVVMVAFLLGGLENAGFTLQGPDFPSGLVGVMKGIILFCVLGGELLVRYRLRLSRPGRAAPAPAPAAARAETTAP
jgi:general nucleoside transport system permease protein